ncbi:hypothetical protein FRB94_002586 [Tulasnella sp. JGI-2019a]|nr:hypothetical protein FRB93_004934 [Tulasnella sp. JGI-2019a]KAG9004230.1 hypothetical protein FRB94_002586 [Tulasnella sp. JGI-2019a]KAG9031901.1 hypothetical protein FRB95_002107 [Tulasnella sp. JGI-2019a]
MTQTTVSFLPAHYPPLSPSILQLPKRQMPVASPSMMSDVPTTLDTVNLDILLLVVKQGLSVHDLLNLRMICHRLYDFASNKSPWIVLLRRLSRLRPLPMPPFRSLNSLSVDELIAIAIRTDNLIHNWSSQSPEARPSYRLVTFTPQDVIVSMLLIPQTPYVLTLSVGGGMRALSWITCVDTEKGKKVARYRSDGLVSSWRAEPVTPNVVVIALLIGPEDRATISPDLPAHYNVIRLGLPDARTHTPASFMGISSHLITSPITGMFLTTEVAGLVSVIRSTQTSGLLMTRFRDGTTAYIDSSVPVTPKPNLNTIANQADLILYSEDNIGASAFAYSFTDDLLPLFTPSPTNAPQKLLRMPPSTVQSYKFHPAELCERANNAYTIIRTRWKPMAAAKIAPYRSGHSEISVLSMAFYLGEDPSGANDHRCISHMFLDPFHRIKNEAEESHPSLERSSSSSDLKPGTPVFIAPESFVPSSALSGNHGASSPTMTIVSDLSDEAMSVEKADGGKKDQMVRRTFHSCLEEKREVWQGPSRNDLISVGLGASHAIWLATGEGDPELKLASFEEPPLPLPLRCQGNHGSPSRTSAVGLDEKRIGVMPPKVIRTLRLPLAIQSHEISALALDDANGIIALATAKGELWLLDYGVMPGVGKEFA